MLFVNEMNVLSFIKRWSLVVSLCFGTLVYLLFARVPLLEPAGVAAGPWLVGALPVLLFVLLFVTFCKIDVHDLRPRPWHLWLQLLRIALSVALVGAIVAVGSSGARLVLVGVFVCVACPTAAAAAVVTEKLGGSIASMTIYTIIDNLVTSVVVPLLLPLVERGVDVPFVTAMLMVLRNVAFVLVVPLVLALACRKVLPRMTAAIAGVHNLAFYIWCVNLSIVTGVTVRNILHATVSGTTLVMLLMMPLVVTLALFSMGKAVGRAYGDSVSAGQALGQKNTVVGIWIALTFLDPLAALAPGAYVIWQNLVNAWQIWYKEKYGRVKW